MAGLGETLVSPWPPLALRPWPDRWIPYSGGGKGINGIFSFKRSFMPIVQFWSVPLLSVQFCSCFFNYMTFYGSITKPSSNFKPIVFH
jgi:hypothetical protein